MQAGLIKSGRSGSGSSRPESVSEMPPNTHDTANDLYVEAAGVYLVVHPAPYMPLTMIQMASGRTSLLLNSEGGQAPWLKAPPSLSAKLSCDPKRISLRSVASQN